MRRFRKLQRSIPGTLCVRYSPNGVVFADARRNRYDDDAAWLRAVSEIIHEILNSLIMIQDGTTTLSYEMAIDRFADSEQSVNERIDAKIDKDIKALGQIKTMKAIGIGKPRAPATTEPLKQIESSTIQMVEGD